MMFFSVTTFSVYWLCMNCTRDAKGFTQNGMQHVRVTALEHYLRLYLFLGSKEFYSPA
ncbi:hypothetical protein OIU77_025840 [Salix suchowensis]|uniref:Uncharacterized protein n=1 Tax=Salix suchowensis TaxID=1278906 RepID=A0ABQ9BXL8_9ROSI|nr:hypothetical protein OIU77_025840 [Salix suchowensis]